jgi:hypothetical protein
MATPKLSPYPPLPHDGDHIRLIALQPGGQDDDLGGDFVLHNLKNAKPPYIATSYVCGNDDRSVYYIMMSGVRVGIYKNADEVLRRFRSASEMKYLWMDVICSKLSHVV